MKDLVDRLIERRKILFAQESEHYDEKSLDELNSFSELYKFSKINSTITKGTSVSRNLNQIIQGNTSETNNISNELSLIKAEKKTLGISAKSLSEKIIERHKSQQRDEPEYHPSWKLMRVIAGHTGWVRSLCVEPDNEWFASGSVDSTIKIWDLASAKLKLTLTGHIMAVRGISISDRHPYMFSCSEDKTIKCWDLERNAIVRDYYGHLSAVYSIDLHPTLDVLVTGGRDSSVRLWDMRTRVPIHVMTGHNSNVLNVKARAVDPQIISTSSDGTIRLWDIVAGKTMKVLTNHSKSVRALSLNSFENSFVTASPNQIKKWAFPEGNYIEDFTPPHNSIINTLSVNHDGVLFSGADNGSMNFYDYKTGVKFQESETTKMPGSIDSEGGIFVSTFDKSGSRLITGEADKTIKIWKEDS
ncbi:mRNA splicing protein [Saccharomycopsis crataegensis]|uniref:Pre-mRNA-splicing factor PRP46 n=1 Tax=Saccharomycopsis crataegensis TaxID=43959 RepID=A0AAV5QRJ3_9ASCO|nr:mRNA splicing protein [Saccharomycopsis crataegensis]